MFNTGFKSFNEPKPVLYKISRWLQEKTKISETKFKVSKTVRQNVRYPPQYAIIHVIMQKIGFVQIDIHARGFTKSFKNHLECGPIFNSAHSKKDHIIYKKEMSNGEIIRDLNTLNQAILYNYFITSIVHSFFVKMKFKRSV